MREFLVRLLLAAAVTLAVCALSSAGYAQQADEDAAPATPHQKQDPSAPAHPTSQQQSPTTPDKKTTVSNSNNETQDALAFTGRVVEQKGALVLSDPVTKMTYQLDEPSKVKPYLGKQVKVVGKLEMKSNTILIDSVELVP